MDDNIRLYNELMGYKYVYVYGAGSGGQTFCNFVDFPITGFVVTRECDANCYVMGMPVYCIKDIINQRDECLIIVAVHDNIANEIFSLLNKYGFYHVIDCTYESYRWSCFREDYFKNKKNNSHQYILLKDMMKDSYFKGTNEQIRIFMITSHMDKKTVHSNHDMVGRYVEPLQVGAGLTDKTIAKLRDDSGENISKKNAQYCELTGHYWIWKNISASWVGVCHYRRQFDLTSKEIEQLPELPVDVVLTTPNFAFPDVESVYIRDHIKSDWQTMLYVLSKREPEYYDLAKKVFKYNYYYAYNMMIARKVVFDDYCEWLFPLLFKIEKYCDNKRRDKYQNRYIGFLAERLTSLYFMKRHDDLRIAHVNKKYYC